MKLVSAALLLLAGAATGLATVAVHQVGWALALAALATIAVLVALGRGWWTRLPFGLGWVGFVAWVTPARDEGDYAVSSDPAGYALIALAVVVLVYSIVTLPPPRRGQAGSTGDPS